ncbi:unnamed protein product [Arctogadus glacialis]
MEAREAWSFSPSAGSCQLGNPSPALPRRWEAGYTETLCFIVDAERRGEDAVRRGGQKGLLGEELSKWPWNKGRRD